MLGLLDVKVEINKSNMVFNYKTSKWEQPNQNTEELLTRIREVKKEYKELEKDNIEVCGDIDAYEKAIRILDLETSKLGTEDKKVDKLVGFYD